MAYKYDPPRGHSPQTTRADILAEFGRWNAQAGSQVVSDYDLPMFRPGVKEAEVVYFLRGRRVPVRMNKWDDFATNLRCCYLIIRDMRLAEARGMDEAMREAYTALPAPKTERDPWEVLGLRPGVSAGQIEAAYRALAKEHHPDSGGSTEAMATLNAAYERVKAEVGQ